MRTQNLIESVFFFRIKIYVALFTTGKISKDIHKLVASLNLALFAESFAPTNK